MYQTSEKALTQPCSPAEQLCDQASCIRDDGGQPPEAVLLPNLGIVTPVRGGFDWTSTTQSIACPR